MKEDFLHYLWKFQKFNTGNLTTTNAQRLTVLAPGQHNHNAGPDFFNAQLLIDGQRWAGNVEIHIKASHWFAHAHQEDETYQSVILHVVWEHDTDISRNDGTPIPTLALQPLVPNAILSTYRKLFSQSKCWIPCEEQLPRIDDFVRDHWLERLYVERLERKSQALAQQLEGLGNNWEALLFQLLCKNFGLKVNGEAFLSIAQSLPFSVVKKCAQHPQQLEALLMGQAQLLDTSQGDEYYLLLRKEYQYLKHKFSIDSPATIPLKFFRLRPSSFPTIRLSQLAQLYASRHSLFSEVMSANHLHKYYELFSVEASAYWTRHYTFGVPSSIRKKQLTKAFVDLLILNTLIPLRFSFAAYQGRDETNTLLELVQKLPAEDNRVIRNFATLNVPVKNAQQSQALLQLKNDYCDKVQCLQCAIGNSILAQGPK
ncbi:MAG: hypothetical protein CMC08_03030 [Flavobacteriaceae bacterium]|nr:hypothetical protein [Flavobacteriaceae bacterium]